MESPFNFGNVVQGAFFVNREAEKKRLQLNFHSGINTILISPRRYGKSSLVRQVVSEMQSPDIKFVFIDLFNIRSEEDFYRTYLQQTIKSTLSKQNEILNAAKEFLKKIIPVFSFSIDPQNDLSVSFNWLEVQKSKDEILNLPELIAIKKGFKIVICIDEFQNISNYHDSLLIEKELRSYWQNHRQVRYCLYGSKKHMMKNIFNKEERPFYRFGDMVLLNRIDEQHWKEYIQNAFARTQKQISSELSASIAQNAENHPYYVQQLAYNTWEITVSETNRDILESAIAFTVQTNAIFYQEIFEQLSNTQITMLYAAIDGVTRFSSSEVMRKYHLGTLNNITKNKDTLEKKEILEFQNTIPIFIDPFFKLWLIGQKNQRSH